MARPVRHRANHQLNEPPVHAILMESVRGDAFGRRDGTRGYAVQASAKIHERLRKFWKCIGGPRSRVVMQ